MTEKNIIYILMINFCMLFYINNVYVFLNIVLKLKVRVEIGDIRQTISTEDPNPQYRTFPPPSTG